MGRALKLLGLVVAALVLLAVVVVAGVALFVDPNDYKQEIQAAVADATGRELTLEGDLELALFPGIRIALGPAELANAPGFGDAPFARIERAELELAILPLLSRRIEVVAARLDGLALNLARNAAGVDNWQDLGQAGAAEPAADEGGAPLDLDVGLIEVRNASVSWNDAATGSSWLLENFGLEASDLRAGTSFPLSMQFSLSGADLAADVAATTRATLALAENTYRLEDLHVLIGGSGEAWPANAGDLDLRFESFGADLNAETLDLENLALEFMGVSVTGDLAGRNLMSDLELAGGIEIAEFDPRDVLDALALEFETADPEALRRASARADFVHDSRRTMLEDMTLTLDDSELVGSLGMRGETLAFSLDLDEINGDRYLPPAAEGDAADEGSVDEIDLPLDLLRTLSAEGDFDIGQAQFTSLRLSDARLELSAGDGVLRLVPTASLYGGTSEGEITIEVAGDTARFSIVEAVRGVDLDGFASDYLGIEELSGTGTVTLDLTSEGANVGQMRRDLDGDVSFSFTDGAWEGIDVWYELKRLKARTEGEGVPPRPSGAPMTPFSSVSASGVVEDALLTNRDFNATLPFMTVDGTGTVNLLDNTLDFDLTAAFQAGPELEEDPLMADLAGVSMPLAVGGTLDALEIRPDFAALVRERARQEVQEEVEQERSEAQERIEQERGEAEERVRDRLRNLLD